MGAARLHLRLFLDGIEVPVISATVSINTNAPATAAVQIVPTDTATEILPRTTVMLFYYDDTGLETDIENGLSAIDRGTLKLGSEAKRIAELAKINTGTGALQDVRYTDEMREALDQSDLNSAYSQDILRRYRLFFAGEVIGYHYSPRNSLTLQCMDFSNYLDYFIQHFWSPGALGDEADINCWVSGMESSNMYISQLITQSSVVRNYIFNANDTKFTLPQFLHLNDVKGLLGGILKLIAGVAGVDPNINSVGGITSKITLPHLFYSPAFQRVRMLEQFFASTSDEITETLLSIDGFSELIQSRTWQLNDPLKMSLRDLLKLLFSEIYYEFVPIPTAYYNGKRDILNTFAMKPDLFFSVPPTCNVVFPDDVVDYSYGRNFMNEVTRLLARGTTRSNIAGKIANYSQIYFAPSTEGVIKELIATRSIVGDGYATFLRSLFPHEVFSGPVPAVSSIYDDANTIRQSIGGSSEVNADLAATLDWKKKLYKDRVVSMQRYLSDAADYEFFKLRFQSRLVSVQAKFLPRLVCGLPSVLIDSGFDNPRHLIGNVVSITHSVHCIQGGLTQYTMDKARIYDESLVGVCLSGSKPGYLAESVLAAQGTLSATTSADLNSKLISMETVVSPPWYSTSYQPDKIGKDIYQEMLGCNSIVDGVEAVFGDDEIAAMQSVTAMIENDEIREEVSNLVGLLNTSRGVSTVDRAANVPSVAQVVTGIGALYKKMSQNQKDVKKFIDSYTFRPIARLCDLMNPSLVLEEMFRNQRIDLSAPGPALAAKISLDAYSAMQNDPMSQSREKVIKPAFRGRPFFHPTVGGLLDNTSFKSVVEKDRVTFARQMVILRYRLDLLTRRAFGPTKVSSSQ